MKQEEIDLFKVPVSNADKVKWFYNKSMKFINQKTKEHKILNVVDPVYKWAYDQEHEKI